MDPCGKVKRAIVTHAHSDHGRPGHQSYLCSETCESLLRTRIGKESHVETADFGKKVRIGDAIVSFHPAGHILGSAQIRIEVKGRVWVVSGDYKPQTDPTCESFELVKCHVFISECTFGLPVYRWSAEQKIHHEINQWWAGNSASGHASILLAYSLGKAQRVLAGLDDSIGPIYAHSAVLSFVDHYRKAGVRLPEVKKIEPSTDFPNAIVVAPPAVEDSTWIRRFGHARKGFASGWMAIRGARRRRNLDRGFVLSDHADWDGLNQVIQGTEAEEVLLTHGDGEALSRYLRERGMNCSLLAGAVIRGEEEE